MFGLNSILKGFEKTLKRLEKFQERNATKIGELRLDLDVAEREQERSVAAADKMREFLGE